MKKRRWKKKQHKVGSTEKQTTDWAVVSCLSGGESFCTRFEPAEPLWWIRAPLAVGNDLYPVWLMKQFHSWSMCLAASSRTKHWFWILTWESVKMFSQPNAKGKAAVEQPPLRDTHISVCLAFNYFFFTKVNFFDFQLYFKRKQTCKSRKAEDDLFLLLLLILKRLIQIVSEKTEHELECFRRVLCACLDTCLKHLPNLKNCMQRRKKWIRWKELNLVWNNFKNVKKYWSKLSNISNKVFFIYQVLICSLQHCI